MRAKAALLVTLLCVACGPWRRPQEVVVAQQTQPSTFDPHLANETVVWSTLSNVLEGLVRFSPRLELEPALAERWEQESPTRLRFVLRPGVVFHNGKPLSARDVVASLRRAQSHPRSQVRHFLAGVVRVEAVGEREVVVETASPAPTLLRRLVFVLVVPEEQCGEEEIRIPGGTGPYRIAQRRDHTLELAAVPWWGGTPQVRRARFLFVENDKERTALFFAGKLDVCAWVREEDLGELRGRGELRVLRQPRLAVQLLAVIPQGATGETAKALGDPRVRRALLLALDRESLVQEVAGGEATVASQMVHPLVFGYDPGLSPAPYDPEAARKLLAEAGFPQGFQVALGIGSGAEPTGKAIAASWEKVGIRTQLLLMPFPELMDAARGRRLPLVFFARTCTTSDASELLDPHTHCPDPAKGLGLENYPGFCDSRVDQLLEAAASELTGEKRRAMLQQAQRLVLEQGYYLPVLIRWSWLGVKKPLVFEPRYDQFLFLAGFSISPGQ
jgi:peptide/nickel transport system substrate-binding protein